MQVPGFASSATATRWDDFPEGQSYNFEQQELDDEAGLDGALDKAKFITGLVFGSLLVVVIIYAVVSSWRKHRRSEEFKQWKLEKARIKAEKKSKPARVDVPLSAIPGLAQPPTLPSTSPKPEPQPSPSPPRVASVPSGGVVWGPPSGMVLGPPGAPPPRPPGPVARGPPGVVWAPPPPGAKVVWGPPGLGMQPQRGQMMMTPRGPVFMRAPPGSTPGFAAKPKGTDERNEGTSIPEGAVAEGETAEERGSTTSSGPKHFYPTGRGSVVGLPGEDGASDDGSVEAAKPAGGGRAKGLWGKLRGATVKEEEEEEAPGGFAAAVKSSLEVVKDKIRAEAHPASDAQAGLAGMIAGIAQRRNSVDGEETIAALVVAADDGPAAAAPPPPPPAPAPPPPGGAGPTSLKAMLAAAKAATSGEVEAAAAPTPPSPSAPPPPPPMAAGPSSLKAMLAAARAASGGEAEGESRPASLQATPAAAEAAASSADEGAAAAGTVGEQGGVQQPGTGVWGKVGARLKTKLAAQTAFKERAPRPAGPPPPPPLADGAAPPPPFGTWQQPEDFLVAERAAQRWGRGSFQEGSARAGFSEWWGTVAQAQEATAAAPDYD